MKRPIPPRRVLESMTSVFEPSPQLEAWGRATFINSGSPLYSVEHDHLNSAKLGVLWTNVRLIIRGGLKAAVTMLPLAMGSSVDRGMREAQVLGWFGLMPDFLMVYNVHAAKEASDRDFCRLYSHELRHCGQKLKHGLPDFDKQTCKPKFAMRPHDREFFDGDVIQFGARLTLGNLVDHILETKGEPEIPDTDIAQMCGTCAMKR